MSSTGAGYDLSANTFSPDGRVFQVEYAQKAVENSGLAVGIVCVDGVVLGVEKTMHSKLLLPSSNPRIFRVDTRAGVAFAGYNADGRPLADRIKQEADHYRDTYGSSIPPHELSNRTGQYVHAHTVYGGYRPVGVSVLIAGFDDVKSKHTLHVVDPSGVQHRYKAFAVGKSKNAAKTEIEKLDLTRITCEQAVKEVAKIVRLLHDDVKDKDYEFEAAWISPAASNNEFSAVPAEVRQAAHAWAVAEVEAMEESSGDDDAM